MTVENIRNSGDVTRIAMGMLPVATEEELADKLYPYKEASAKLLEEIIRSVNVENQYHRLKVNNFNLSKAASLMGKPFNTADVLSLLDKDSVGKLKAAVVTDLSFSQMSVICKNIIRRKKASIEICKIAEDVSDIITGFINSKEDGDREKLVVLKDMARSRKAAILNIMKGVADEIARLMARDPRMARKYAELDVYRTEPVLRHRKLRITDIVKWAGLNQRMFHMDNELKLVNLTLGEE